MSSIEWEVQGNYGQGWETLCTEDNHADAVCRLNEYNYNEPQFRHRIQWRHANVKPEDVITEVR